jgi:hypothetical protein
VHHESAYILAPVPQTAVVGWLLGDTARASTALEMLNKRLRLSTYIRRRNQCFRKKVYGNMAAALDDSAGSG